MIILLFLAPRQIMFQCPGPTKQDLLFALNGPLIFYSDIVLKAVTLLSLGFICTLLTTSCKMMSSSLTLCLVLFATAHADQCAFCVTLLDLLMLFYFKSSTSPNSSLSSADCAHCLLLISLILDPGEVFVCCTHNLSSLKLVGKLAWRGGCRCSELQPHSLLMCMNSSDRCLSAAVHCSYAFSPLLPWPEGSAQGGQRDLETLTGGEKVKIPSDSTPAVYFAMWISRQEDRHEQGSVHGRCHHHE